MFPHGWLAITTLIQHFGNPFIFLSHLLSLCGESSSLLSPRLKTCSHPWLILLLLYIYINKRLTKSYWFSSLHFLYQNVTSDLLTSQMNYCRSLLGAFPIPGTLLFDAYCYHTWPIFTHCFLTLLWLPVAHWVKFTPLFWPYLSNFIHATFFFLFLQYVVSALVKPKIFYNFHLQASGHKAPFI